MVRSPKISSESQHIGARDPQPGYQLIAGPPQSPLSYLEFGLLTLAAGHPPFTWETREREVALHLLGGTCEVTVSGGAGALAGTLGPRRDVFGGPPAALFAPAGSRVGLSALHDSARLAVLSVPPAGDRPPSLISSMQVVTRAVGKDSWTRRVTSVVDRRVSSRLLAGEPLHAAGPWSSSPPHKHDANLPGKEVPMEEVYHYFVQPRAGFGLQMVYTAPGDPHPFERVYRVRDGDTVVIPRGYHPVVAAGGDALAYPWGISGGRVDYGAWGTDPAPEWLLTPNPPWRRHET